MAVYPTMRIDVGLTRYQDAVVGDAPDLYYRLNEPYGDSTIDFGSDESNGFIFGSPTLGVAGPIPTGGMAMAFDGVDDYVAPGVFVFQAGVDWSLEVWVWLHPDGQGTNRAIWSTVAGGPHVGVNTSNQFFVGRIDGSAWAVTDATARSASTWYHLVVTYDVTANRLRIYVDGALVTGPTVPGGAWSNGATLFLGVYDNGGTSRFFHGRMDEAAVYGGPVGGTLLSAARVLAHYTAAQWTNIIADTVADAGASIRYGISGHGPLDRIAGAGQADFTLRNDTGNSGGLQGYYSPGHANKRVGWAKGIPVKVTLSYSGTDYVKFRGKTWDIVPEPGQYRSQRVQVTANDVLRDLADCDVREVALELDKTEAELMAAVLGAVADAARPVAMSLGAGVDTLPHAFNDVESGKKAAGLLQGLVTSTIGLLFVKGDGTLTYIDRHSTALNASAFTFTNTMRGLVLPSSMARTFNAVSTTTHPKTVSATATEELYSLPNGSTVELRNGFTVEVWTPYSDPNNREVNVGGTAVVTVLSPGTHYAVNSAQDGSGVNLSSQVAVALEPFASTAKWTFLNVSGMTGYVTLQKVIGKVLRDPAPRRHTAESTQAYGRRSVHIDMAYQDDSAIGDGVAIYVEAQYSLNDNRPESIEFLANDSADLMTQALAREPGDRITITEAVTGASSAEAIITSVELDIRPGLIVTCRWGLQPVEPFVMWRLGIAGVSELGETTVLGV